MSSGFYIEPLSFVSGAAARALAASGDALPLARPGLAFSAVRIHCRSEGAVRELETLPVSRLRTWAREHGADVEPRLSALQLERPSFVGVDLGRPAVMGVLNVTPDSFSDGGDFFDFARAIDHAEEMVAAGADVIDVGGESTRPGALPLSEEEELRRVVPVVRALADRGALVSVDTRKARVMRDAVEQGARIVNDVSALAGDRDSLAVVADSGASVILMHMLGEPATMQDAPAYVDVLADVYDALEARVAVCREAGIATSRIAVDPGIGFGKSARHNLRLIEGLGTFQSLGCAVALGVSRKGFIGRLANAEAPKDRGPGSLALALAGVERGANLLRVHDVGQTRQAFALWEAVTSVTGDGDRASDYSGVVARLGAEIDRAKA